MGRRAVLVVDDDRLVRRALARELQRGFDVIEASSVPEALGVLTARGQDLCAVVSDLDLGHPTADGLTVLGHVRAAHPACIRVLVSARASREALRIFESSGAIHRGFAKPWDAGAILASIRGLSSGS